MSLLCIWGIRLTHNFSAQCGIPAMELEEAIRRANADGKMEAEGQKETEARAPGDRVRTPKSAWWLGLRNQNDPFHLPLIRSCKKKSLKRPFLVVL